MAMAKFRLLGGQQFDEVITDGLKKSESPALKARLLWQFFQKLEEPVPEPQSKVNRLQVLLYLPKIIRAVREGCLPKD